MSEKQAIKLYNIPSKLPIQAWSPNVSKTFIRRDGTPLYTLPIIHDPNTGKTISDSPQIAEYLEETYPDTPRLFPLAFYDAFEDHRLHNQLRFVMPKTLIILNPPSYEFFKETREKRFRSITMDDFYPKGQEKEELWKDNWAVIDSWLKKNPTGDFVFGETITWADFVLAEWVIWYRILFGVDSEEWKDIASWHDGSTKLYYEVHYKLQNLCTVRYLSDQEDVAFPFLRNSIAVVFPESTSTGAPFKTLRQGPVTFDSSQMSTVPSLLFVKLLKGPIPPESSSRRLLSRKTDIPDPITQHPIHTSVRGRPVRGTERVWTSTKDEERGFEALKKQELLRRILERERLELI
ncbi:hypothetical protein WG66_002098 [Moniliophthora roreri]|nr:hypothetical protein WG66_002098 [Moniliophthora roreri]